MTPLCWIHAHPTATPWLQDAMCALRAVPGLQLTLFSQWPPAPPETPATGPDVVVLDADDATAACRALVQLRALQMPCRAFAVTPTRDARTLHELMQAGADDFVATPLRAEELVLRVQRTLGMWPACTAMQDDADLTHKCLAKAGLIGQDPAFVQQLQRLCKVAATDAGVLLLGETGTGKELFAQAVHYESPRATGPWVAVNCGALPAELIESELFGHVKGAYTHAVSARPGLIRQAAGGSVFLDEIDSLPLPAQAKLLRFLQSKEVRPVGANQAQHVDVRVIAASNRNLSELVARGLFRQDLYFRLNVLSIELPSLRERRSDIPMLALHFVKLFATRFGRRVDALTPSAMRALVQHGWPGNVRELMHVIERAVLLTGMSQLDACDLDLPGNPAAPATPVDSMRSAKARVVAAFERSYIEQLLVENGGNITHAARAARKNRRAFFALMRKYGVPAVKHDISGGVMTTL